MTGAFRRLARSDIFRHGALVLAATMLGNLAAFGYHAVVSRHLGVAEYGVLYALISFASLVGLPIAFLPTVVARYAAEFRSLGDERHMRALARFVVRFSAILGAGLTLLLILLSVPIADFLHVSPWFLPPTALLAALAIFSPMVRAVLQGESDFAGYSWSAASEGFGKLAFGAALAIAGFGVVGGLAGFTAGSVAGLILASAILMRRYGAVERVPFHIDWRRVLQTSWGAAAVSIAVAVLTSSDVILVKHFFPAHYAGLYAAASLGGKIMLFGVGFAPTILLPKATQRHARGEKTRNTLIGAAAMLAGVGACGLLVFHVAGSIVLRALVGAEFIQATPLLVWYGFAMTLLAGTNLLSSYALALHRFTFTVPVLLASLVEPVGIFLWHRSLQSVMDVLVAANMLALLATGFSLWFDSIRARLPAALRTDGPSIPR